MPPSQAVPLALRKGLDEPPCSSMPAVYRGGAWLLHGPLSQVHNERVLLEVEFLEQVDLM